ncbi:MAG: hypothetical protein KF712_19695 [Akkermansiaceae bacterium]|nr:hypothetical protein [Akkermansiaceae bacterium]
MKKEENREELPYNLIPNSREEAHLRLEVAMTLGINDASTEVFLGAWWALCWLNPGLHPDDYENWEFQVWREIAVEAFKRAENGGIRDRMLYPAEAVHHRLSIERAMLGAQVGLI